MDEIGLHTHKKYTIYIGVVSFCKEWIFFIKSTFRFTMNFSLVLVCAKG